MATQNPIEQEGTYPLPEAQLDRFMLKIQVGYPTREEEIQIVERMAGSSLMPKTSPVMTLEEIEKASIAVQKVGVDDRIKGYTVDIVTATRDPKNNRCGDLEKFIEAGASVRASINLIKLAKAKALLDGRITFHRMISK